jgi:PIN domain nuclease of toxin-antitoxin system
MVAPDTRHSRRSQAEIPLIGLSEFGQPPLIAIKRRLGKIIFQGPIIATIACNGFHELPILPVDGENAGDLEWTHSDPFDRLLVAQAIRLGFTLLTADRAIRTFGDVAQIWAG